MPDAQPASIRTALEALTRTFSAAGGKTFDPMRSPWPEVEQLARTALGGPFVADRAEHRTLQLRLGALFGARLVARSNALWFRQRDAVGGFSLGFPNAVFTVSPFSVVALALAADQLSALEEAAAKIETDYARTLKEQGPSRQPLDATAYERFFDPAFVEFVALDEGRAHAAWAMTPRRLLEALKDAQLRAAGLEGATREWLERELLAGLRALDQGAPLIEQASRDLRVVERVGELFAARSGTGLTTEAGWLNVALRLLSLDPAQDPEITEGAIAGIRKGAGPFKAFLHEAALRPEAPREGILGVFSPGHLSAPHPALEKQYGLRLVRANPRPLLPLLQRFDADRVRAGAERYERHLSQQLGQRLERSPQESALLDEGLGYAARLQKTLALAVRDQLDFCIRRAPEAEGRTGPGKAELRAALQS